MENHNVQYILDEHSARYEKMGGKAGALARLAILDLNIPEWFVVTPDAFLACLSDSQKKLWEQGELDSFIADIQAMSFQAQVATEVTAAAERFDDGAFFAVRSSASDEDGSETSFAGQLESFLYVGRPDLLAYIIKVWQSGFTPRVLAYRREHDLAGMPGIPAVLVQRMIDAETAGVAFGVNPVDEDVKTAVVSAVYGLGSALVGGDASADTYHVDWQNHIVHQDIAVKDILHRGSAAGVSVVDVAEAMQDKAVLTEREVVEVAVLARSVGRHFGKYQDIEWAYEQDRLYLLQSRPITSLGRVAEKEGQLNLWDNSNIAESYGGVTTPLTFSFIRRAYEEAYRQMCILFSVPAREIQANELTFKRMLGLINGRVFYNLISWYRLLAILPGYRFNRKFMEQMMGVKKELPPELLREIRPASGRERLLDAISLLAGTASLFKSLLGLEKQIRDFYARLGDALSHRDLEQMTLTELAAYYRELERKLLTKWDAPLVNDFFAMIFYGLLRSLTGKLCAGRNDSLHNDLLCGEGGIISSEPARWIKRMAVAIQGDAALVDTLSEGEPAVIARMIRSRPDFSDEVGRYIEKFGDRCLDELKLESHTLLDNPLPLYRSVGSFARRFRDNQAAKEVDEELIRRNAEEEVARALKGMPVKAFVLGVVLKNARRLVRNRENLRFERTRLFGRIRRLFLEAGMRLASLGALADRRDVFYLEVEEVLRHEDGTATTNNLKGLVELRRAEYESFKSMPSPGDRFETRGPVNIGNAFVSSEDGTEVPQGDSMQGIGCCPGIVTGRVRIITDPAGAQLRQGEILVAERTDPGWIILFPAASGILVARGSLLSHSAIVAREMGIPAVVSLSGITGWLNDGDFVTFDGSTGMVTKISRAKDEDNAQ